MTTDRAKIKPTHLCRVAFVYLRQSTQAQLERTSGSTRRRYALIDRAMKLGRRREPVRPIDEDGGLSGSGLSERMGFAHRTAEAALGHVGLILGIEVPTLARNNADGYRLRPFDPAARVEAFEIPARLIAQASAAPAPREETRHDD